MGSKLPVCRRLRLRPNANNIIEYLMPAMNTLRDGRFGIDIMDRNRWIKRQGPKAKSKVDKNTTEMYNEILLKENRQLIQENTKLTRELSQLREAYRTGAGIGINVTRPSESPQVERFLQRASQWAVTQDNASRTRRSAEGNSQYTQQMREAMTQIAEFDRQSSERL